MAAIWFICLYLLSVVTAVFKFPSTVKFKNEEFVRISITDISHQRIKRSGFGRHIHTTKPYIPQTPNAGHHTVTTRPYQASSDTIGSNLLPSLVHINFRLGNKDVHYDLKKRPTPKIPTPMYTSISDRSIRLHRLSSMKHVGAYYEGVNDNILMHLECISNTSSTCTDYKMFGTFERDADQHFLEPSIVPSDLGEECLFHRVGQPDIIEPFNLEPLNLTKADVRQSKMPHDVHNTSFNHTMQGKPVKMKSRWKRATGTYTIEVYLIIDASVYNFWRAQEHNSDNMAMLRIRQYYTFLMFGVDYRYRNMRSVYRMRVNLVGIYVSRSSSDIPFMVKNRRCDGRTRCQLDANRALSQMRDWIVQKGLPKHDHMMLFTRDEMQSGYGETSGTSYVNSICSSRSTSIVEDNFDFIAATIAAHELGHSLGALHDGDNNRCSSQSGYIMVSVSQAKRRPYHRSPWEFSRCSVEEIGLILDDLDRSKSPNCLRQANPSAGVYSIGTETRLGQTFNVDKQCELMQGRGSTACRDFLTNTEEVCTGLWCRTTQTSRGEICVMSLPAEGTSCGHNMWCVGYECRFDSRAPRINAGCIFGDRPGAILGRQTCADLIRREPWQCYSRSVMKNCCETCYRIKTNITNCEYGDKSRECAVIKRLGRCSIYRNQCCYTCR